MEFRWKHGKDMRPYLAIIKDSFREAIASRVLWILLVIVTVALLGIAPLSFRQVATVDLRDGDVEEWPLLIEELREASQSETPTAARRVWSLLDDEGKKLVAEFKGMPDKPTLRDVGELQKASRTLFKSLNSVLRRDDLYDEQSWKGAPVGPELRELQKTPYAKLSQPDRLRTNRLLLEAAFPDRVSASSHTSLAFRYAMFDLMQPFPLRKQQFIEALFTKLPYFIDKFVLSVGSLIAVLVTAPIIPQMFDPGSLHLLLSKPITRPLLYLSKFLGGCAFVTLAAGYLFVGLWLIIGVQWGVWEPQLLWCIPVYVFVFATYYSVTALVGAMSRNTVIAILLTAGFWVMCFVVSWGESGFADTIRRYRLSRVVPAADEMLAADEVNTILTWDQETRQWRPLFASAEHEQIRMALVLLPELFFRHPQPLVGPVFDKVNGQVVAATTSFKALGRTVMVSARPETKWKLKEGAPPSGQPIAFLLEPDGHPLLVTSTGLFRVVRDASASAVMLKLPGLDLPLSQAEALQNVSPSPAPYWLDPSAAAGDIASGRVYVYCRGELTALAHDGDNYRVTRTTKITDDEHLPAVLAAGGDRVYVALKTGKVLAYAGGELTDAGQWQLPKERPPRIAAASPDGQRLFILTHDGSLSELSVATGRITRPAVRGQGDISALTLTADSKLYLVSRATRISEYELATMRELRTISPALNLQERAYYYGIQPLHTVLPKPGEFYNTVQYLLIGEETTGKDDKNLATAQRKLDPWSPIYSGLAFQAVMLLIGCFYIQRQEF